MKVKRKAESLKEVEVAKDISERTLGLREHVVSPNAQIVSNVNRLPPLRDTIRSTVKTPRKFSERKFKSPFKLLKDSSPEVTEDILERYSTFKPDLLFEKQQNIYIKGHHYDMRNKCETDMLLCRMLKYCVSSLAVSSELIFVGLKDNLEPFNLFNFATKGTPGAIAVMTHSIEMVDILNFNHGVATQIHIEEGERVFQMTVLFHDGTLHRFNYNTTRLRPCNRTRMHGESSGSVYSNPRVTNLFNLETSSKIIRFHTLNNTIAYTDGFTVTTVINGERKTSKPFRTLIVDLALFIKDGTEHIFLLDRNGGHFYCKASLTDYVSSVSLPGYYKLLIIPEYNLLLSTDGVIYRNHCDISITPQPLRKKCRFYLSTVDGTVTAHRLLNKDRL
ncbi:hypothetical protein PAEPH01_2149, partial [Pancytospora epiphaga]